MPDSSTLLLKPPLKWAGGKRWLVPHIESLWRRHQQRRYVEPFCGGLAVALALQPERALLNDLNAHLINFYKQIRRGLTLEIEARYDQKLFYEQRARFRRITGVYPQVTTWRGPRTEPAGLSGTTWPVTSQSNR